MDKTARKFMIDDLAIREPTTVSFKEKHITSQDRTMSGKLVVDYIASKKTISVGWGVLNDDEFKKLKALIENKRGKNECYTLTFSLPQNASAAKPSQSAPTETPQSETPPSEPAAPSAPTENTATMTAYTEEVSYYPYFTASGEVVWRDVAIEFSEV